MMIMMTDEIYIALYVTSASEMHGGMRLGRLPMSAILPTSTFPQSMPVPTPAKTHSNIITQL